MTEMTEKIPTNEEIIAMIPSKTVREYLTKIKWQFSEHDRYILRCYLAPQNEEEKFSRLCETGSYVTLPHPFRKGDIVVVCDKSWKNWKPELGIMWGPESDEDFWQFDERAKTKLKNMVDFSDVSTTVDFLEEDGFFNHGHPNPVWIEYAELDKDSPEAEFLESAVKLQKGEGSLEESDWFRRKYIESVKQKREAKQSFIRRIMRKLLRRMNMID